MPCTAKSHTKPQFPCLENGSNDGHPTRLFRGWSKIMDGKYFAIENASSKYTLGLVNPVNEEAGKEKEEGKEENDRNEMEAKKNQ